MENFGKVKVRIQYCKDWIEISCNNRNVYRGPQSMKHYDILDLLAEIPNVEVEEEEVDFT